MAAARRALRDGCLSACMQASETRALGTPGPRLAGRAWLAEYVRGAGHDLFTVHAGEGLHGARWLEAVEAVFGSTHAVLMGAWMAPHACTHAAGCTPSGQVCGLAI